MSPLSLRRALFTCVLLAAAPAAHADFNAAQAALERKNFDTGIRLMIQAADQGDVRATVRLAEIFEMGLGTRRDAEQAWRWRQLAAEQGDAESAFRVGQRFSAGDGVSRSDAGAQQWYRRAAERGHPKAQLELSKLLGAAGHNEADAREATVWYDRAVAAGAVAPPVPEPPPPAAAPPAASRPTLTDWRNEQEYKRRHRRPPPATAFGYGPYAVPFGYGPYASPFGTPYGFYGYDPFWGPTSSWGWTIGGPAWVPAPGSGVSFGVWQGWRW